MKLGLVLYYAFSLISLVLLVFNTVMFLIWRIKGIELINWADAFLLGIMCFGWFITMTVGFFSKLKTL